MTGDERTEDDPKAMPEPPVPERANAWALFLDVDGTLVEFADTPGDVRLDEPGRRRLERLHALLGGALALVSGRQVRVIDEIVAPVRLPAVGIHGAEWRPDERVEGRLTIDHALLDPVRRAFGEFAAQHPGTLLEDKEWTVTLHFRRAPAVEDDAARLAASVAREVGPAFHVLQGKMMLEIRPREATKGSAVSDLMRLEPFRSRTPVYVGDDVTDEDGFVAVNALGGVSVGVSPPPETHAQYALPSVVEVHQWLDRIIDRLETGALRD